jgi:hypothetical protein
MEGGLHQAHSGSILRGDPRHDVLHQTPAHGLVLHRRIDGYRADPVDRIAFIQKIAADDPAVHFRHHRVEARMRQHPRQEAGRYVRRRDVGREVMRLRDGLERLVTDRSAALGIRRVTAS